MIRRVVITPKPIDAPRRPRLVRRGGRYNVMRVQTFEDAVALLPVRLHAQRSYATVASVASSSRGGSTMTDAELLVELRKAIAECESHIRRIEGKGPPSGREPIPARKRPKLRLVGREAA